MWWTKPGESLRILLLLVERTKENWLEEETKEAGLGSCYSNIPRYMYEALGTVWFQPHLMPPGSSSALLPPNWVCFETPRGSQVAGALPSFISTHVHSRRRANKTAPTNVPTHHPGPKGLAPLGTHHYGQQDRRVWVTQPSKLDDWKREKEKRWFLKGSLRPQEEGEGQLCRIKSINATPHQKEQGLFPKFAPPIISSCTQLKFNCYICHWICNPFTLVMMVVVIFKIRVTTSNINQGLHTLDLDTLLGTSFLT